jgi:hypothetical protein
MPEPEVDDEVDDLVPIPHEEAEQNMGQDVRETLVDWEAEH